MTVKPSPADILEQVWNDGASIAGGAYLANLKYSMKLPDALAALDSYYRAYYTALLPTEDNGYESPKWNIPLPAEVYVAYAEGWDKALETIRQRFEGKHA